MNVQNLLRIIFFRHIVLVWVFRSQPIPTDANQCHEMPFNDIQWHHMPCHAVPCLPMPSHAVPCCQMPSNVVKCRPMLSNGVLCRPMLFHPIPCRSIPFYADPSHSMSFYPIPYPSMLIHAMKFHALPCRYIPFHTVLCCSIPFHAVPCQSMPFQFPFSNFLFSNFHFLVTIFQFPLWLGLFSPYFNYIIEKGKDKGPIRVHVHGHGSEDPPLVSAEIFSRCYFSPGRRCPSVAKFYKVSFESLKNRIPITADVVRGLSGVSECVDTGARTPFGVIGNWSEET